tara:strand:- start:2761 stop:3087 length:327 start_codon:yes stop_codon:yes gene_type:complete
MRIRYLFLALLISSASNAFLHNFKLPLTPELSKSIVKTTSGLLPNADSVGHHVLHANKVIIDYLLDNNDITMEYKKPIILLFIKTAQMGDNIGSYILSHYYDIVNTVL